MDKSLCLCVIVKDIDISLFDQIINHINYCIIYEVNTLDHTREMITKFFTKKQIPYEIHSKPNNGELFNTVDVKNFLLEQAKNKADYTIIVYDFEQIKITDQDFKKSLVDDVHSVISTNQYDIKFLKHCIISNNANIKYNGLNGMEYLDYTNTNTRSTIDGIILS